MYNCICHIHSQEYLKDYTLDTFHSHLLQNKWTVDTNTRVPTHFILIPSIFLDCTGGGGFSILTPLFMSFPVTLRLLHIYCPGCSLTIDATCCTVCVVIMRSLSVNKTTATSALAKESQTSICCVWFQAQRFCGAAAAAACVWSRKLWIW